MELKEIVKEIDKLSELHHQWDEDYKTSGCEYDAMLLIAKYILSKGYDIDIGKHKASRLIEIFDTQRTGQNDEEYCGSEEEMLCQMMEICSNSPGLIDDYPIPGKYIPIVNMDRDVLMIINYYESKFWPDSFEIQYDLMSFGINHNKS